MAFRRFFYALRKRTVDRSSPNISNLEELIQKPEAVTEPHNDREAEPAGIEPVKEAGPICQVEPVNAAEIIEKAETITESEIIKEGEPGTEAKPINEIEPVNEVEIIEKTEAVTEAGITKEAEPVPEANMHSGKTPIPGQCFSSLRKALAARATRNKADRQMGRKWRGGVASEALPVEMLIHIATLLCPVDRASLPFVNRHLHGIIGRALKLGYFHDRHVFLSRLEKDGSWLDEILCQICRKFHLPRKSRTWSSQEADRACVQHGDPTALKDMQSPYLPPQIHFDIVAAIARSCRFKSDIYQPHLVASWDNYTNGEAWIKNCISARYIGGKFLLKTETVLVAGRDIVTSRGLEQLQQLIDEHPELGMICQHARWDEIWPFILKPDQQVVEQRGQWCENGPIWDFDVPNKDMQHCLWTHPGTCWTHCDARSRLESRLAGTWACGACSTDYKLSTVRLEGLRGPNAVVFTTWKDLGQGTDVEDKQWQEHICERYVRWAQKYNVARCFEGVEHWGLARSLFVYSPSEALTR